MKDHLPSAALLFLLLAVPAAGQVKVTTLAKGGTPLKQSTAVRLSRFADMAEVNLLKVGDVLFEGDLVTALAPDLFVELTCPKGTLLRFTRSFRAVINPPGEVDCALNDLSGDLDVVTDQPTKVDLGGKTLGTSGTRYAIRLESQAEAPSEQVLVFEGKVEVRAPAGSTLVSTGQTIVFTRQMVKLEPRQVTANEIQRWAGLYAHFDVVKAQAAGVEVTGTPAATEAKLTQLHAAVLSNPTAAQPRLELAREQASNRIGDEALYNFRRSNVIDPAKLQGIRPDGLKRGDAVEYQRLDRLLRESAPQIPPIDAKRNVVVQPPKYVLHSTATPKVVSETRVQFPPSDDELAAWLTAGRFADVVSALEAELASGSLSSREELLLARGYAGTGDKEHAAKAALLALRSSEADRLLSSDELALCRQLSAREH